MGLLKYTKDYTASDDGSKLTGAELGTLQADIAAVINGGITNANISASAAIVESKVTFDTASGHNHDGSNSRTLSSGAFRGFIQGCELAWDSVASVHATSGVMDIAGTLYTRTSVSSTITVTTSTHWVEGAIFGDGSEDANTWIYVYAYNDSGSTWDIKFWMQAPQYADTTSDDSSVKIYRQNAGKWYRCIGAVRNSSSDLIMIAQRGDWVYFDAQVVIAGGTSAVYANVDCSSIIPVLSTTAELNVWNGANGVFTNIPGFTGPFMTFNTNEQVVMIQPLSNTQIFQYKVDGGVNFNANIMGYRLDIR